MMTWMIGYIYICIYIYKSVSFRIHTSVIYHNKLIFPFTYNVCALLYVTYNICAIISPVVGIHTQPLLGMIGIKKKDLKNGDKNG